MPVEILESCNKEKLKDASSLRYESTENVSTEALSQTSDNRNEASQVRRDSISSKNGGISGSQSSNYGMSRNLKAIIKKTSEIVYSSKRTFPTIHVGPSTYGQSFKDIISYLDSTEALSRNQESCEVLKRGVLMQRISRRKQTAYLFKLVNDDAITWKVGAKRLELDSIKDIRVGEMASNYREEYGVSEKVADLWVTIIYAVSNKLKALHVVAQNKNDFNIFVNCVCGLSFSRRELMKSISVPDNEKFANIHWKTSVSDRKEDELKDTLTFEDVRKLCDKFHIYCSMNHLEKLFSMADVNQNGLLNFQEFQTFVKLLKTRPEVKTLWNSLKNTKNELDFDGFYHFLEDIQNENIDRESARCIFNKFCDPRSTAISEKEFIEFLGSQPYVKEIMEDYTKPLNHYFIASSHNTYLLGKQVGESSSVEGYVQALQQGCRCIEIDIWDDDIGPVVCHGFLTGAIPLVNVIEIIKKYAFITSPYPLIISLEINCSRENQIITSSIFQNSLGSLLFQSQFDESKDLPSPKELMHKIVVKGKRTGQILGVGITSDPSTATENTSSYSSSMDSEIEILNKAKEKKTSTRIRRMRRMNISKHVEVSDNILEICGLFGLKFRNFSLPESKTTNHCFSLNEKRFDSMCKDKTQKLSLDKHNRRYLMRVYPHAFRYKSTNFNPVNYWKMGAQMVATNWQTYDLGQQINLAMFQLTNQKNGILHSGYVLKPATLVPKVSKVQDLSSVYQKFKQNPTNINLRVLSAQLLPKPADGHNSKDLFAPYVTVEFITDEDPIRPINVNNGSKISATSASTDFCKENGFNPIWDAEIAIKIRSMDFAFLKFTVKTGDLALATSCFKVEHMRLGYRHIPLFNMEGELYIFSTLFIHINIS